MSSPKELVRHQIERKIFYMPRSGKPLEVLLGLEAFRKFQREMLEISAGLGNPPAIVGGLEGASWTFMGAKVRVHGSDMDVWVREEQAAP